LASACSILLMSDCLMLDSADKVASLRAVRGDAQSGVDRCSGRSCDSTKAAYASEPA
jgi:hypothetical protein